MLNAAFFSLGLIVLCALIHYEALSALKVATDRIRLIPRRTKLLFVVLGAMASHLLQIAGVSAQLRSTLQRAGGIGGPASETRLHRDALGQPDVNPLC